MMPGLQLCWSRSGHMSGTVVDNLSITWSLLCLLISEGVFAGFLFAICVGDITCDS